MTSRRVQIVEVGPRDGLQNQKQHLSTEQKLDFINRAIQAGIRRMESVSLVNPKRVPQMADAEAVMAGVPRDKGVSYIGLALNLKGAERAIEAGCDEVGAVIVASDTFGLKNQNQDIGQQTETWYAISSLCKDKGAKASIMVSAAWGCPFEGEVDPEKVYAILREALKADRVDEVAVADTIGVADPAAVRRMVETIRDITPDHIPVRAHFHNTRNTGLANAYAAVEAGVDALDASLGGIGGCPFAPNATGNIPTEDLIYMLDRMGVETGVDLQQTMAIGLWIGEQLGIQSPALLGRAGAFPKAA